MIINGLGKRLEQQRLLMKLTRKEVSTATGLSVSAISNYENEERTPSLQALIRLARVYRCSTDYLLGFDISERKLVDVSMLDSEQIHLLQKFLSSFES